MVTGSTGLAFEENIEKPLLTQNSTQIRGLGADKPQVGEHVARGLKDPRHVVAGAPGPPGRGAAAPAAAARQGAKMWVVARKGEGRLTGFSPVHVDPGVINPCLLILWMDAILHHLRNPGMMIPLQTPTSNGFPWFKVVQDFVHPQYGGVPGFSGDLSVLEGSTASGVSIRQVSQRHEKPQSPGQLCECLGLLLGNVKRWRERERERDRPAGYIWIHRTS